MYAGHAGLALFAKGRRPELSIALLVPVAFGPDWVQWIFQAAGYQNRQLSHSLVAVILGGVLVAAAYRFLGRGSISGALMLGSLWLSHWPADFITGKKPTWPGGRDVGLLLYDHPMLDVVVESIVVLLCWPAYRRSLPESRQRGALQWIVPASMIALQIGFGVLQGGPMF